MSFLLNESTVGRQACATGTWPSGMYSHPCCLPLSIGMDASSLLLPVGLRGRRLRNCRLGRRRLRRCCRWLRRCLLSGRFLRGGFLAAAAPAAADAAEDAGHGAQREEERLQQDVGDEAEVARGDEQVPRLLRMRPLAGGSAFS